MQAHHIGATTNTPGSDPGKLPKNLAKSDQLKVFKYRSPGSVSAIKIDNRVANRKVAHLSPQGVRFALQKNLSVKLLTFYGRFIYYPAIIWAEVCLNKKGGFD